MRRLLPRRDFLATSAAALAAGRIGWGGEPKAEPVAIGLGYSLYGMKSLSLVEALAACGKAGYDCIELALMPGYHADPAKLTAEDRAKLRDSLAEHKLRVAALMENLLLLGDEKQLQANLDRLKLTGELAHALDAKPRPVIETVLGGKPADWNETRHRMADRLAMWAKVAADAQTVLAIKGHVGNAAHLPEHVTWLLEQVDSPWLKGAYDYSHFQLRGLDLAATLKTLLPRTAFIHVKDARGEPAKFQFLLPGEGTIDYVAYFKLLRELGYRGDVVVEVSGQISSRPDYDPLVAARRCYDSLAPRIEQSGLRRR